MGDYKVENVNQVLNESKHGINLAVDDMVLVVKVAAKEEVVIYNTDDFVDSVVMVDNYFFEVSFHFNYYVHFKRKISNVISLKSM